MNFTMSELVNIIKKYTKTDLILDKIKDFKTNLKWKNTTIILDNGHGIDTPGKQSPDGTLREYKWAREMVQLIYSKLIKLGVKATILVPEEEDVPLAQRCLRANKIYLDSNKNALLVSVHINAAGSDGKWHSASGWSGWVYSKASEKSKQLAVSLYNEAEKAGLKGNRAVPPEKYWTANFYILKNTNCPAVLTENLFQDNKEEVLYLLSDKGKDTIASVHVLGILKFLN